MTLAQRVRAAALALACLIAAGSPALAGPQPLSPLDAKAYAAAFEAAERGDFIEARLQAAAVKDSSLLGHLSFRQFMAPGAYRASFEELKGWLAEYADLPVAERVFSLAAKRRPAGAEAPRAPLLTGPAPGKAGTPARARPADVARSGVARQAFYAGDLKRALDLAPAAGDWWIAGLSAYRLKNYVLAQGYFDKASRDEGHDPWLRSGGAYWAARAAFETGEEATAKGFLHAAARYPGTFYGMIAERQVRLQGAAQAQRAAQGEFVLAAYTAPTPDVSAFVRAEPRAHRAAALAQIGRLTEAGLELRAGLSLAKTPVERQRWAALVMALNAQIPDDAVPAAQFGDYPLPALEPKWGFTIDKALVYAIVRQESRFNPLAVSPSGAIGLMQLMPEAAARAAGDDKLKADMSPLLDPALNLRVGQDYVTWLMERGVGYDILRTVAAYNGGPGTLLKTARMLGEDADSLLIIECLPAAETRNYVEKVMTAYWTYRRQFGQDSQTLEALAKGARFVDARLDKAG